MGEKASGSNVKGASGCAGGAARGGLTRLGGAKNGTGGNKNDNPMDKKNPADMLVVPMAVQLTRQEAKMQVALVAAGGRSNMSCGARSKSGDKYVNCTGGSASGERTDSSKGGGANKSTGGKSTVNALQPKNRKHQANAPVAAPLRRDEAGAREV